MGDRIVIPVGELVEAADRLRAVREALADLDELQVDAEGLGDPAVTRATIEVQRGWHLQRATLRQHLGTLGAYVDAAVNAAEDADATIVSGHAG